MRARCKYPSQVSYKHYGGRGIKICPAWEVYEQFLADMGVCPEKHTLDRIDSDGDYKPGNCRWATMKTQQRNRTNNQLLTFNGKSQPIALWAEELGMKQKTLRARISDYGWTVAEALTKPVGAEHEYSRWKLRPYLGPQLIAKAAIQLGHINPCHLADWADNSRVGTKRKGRTK